MIFALKYISYNVCHISILELVVYIRVIYICSMYVFVYIYVCVCVYTHSYDQIGGIPTYNCYTVSIVRY